MRKIFLTGDIHSDVWDLKQRILQAQVPEGGFIFVLGDVGLNYYLDDGDNKKKKILSQMPYNFLFIHGNHEARPEEVEGYELSLHKLDDVNIFAFTQKRFPNLYFLADGVHLFGNTKILVLGGAYSVDKNYRLATGNKWWESEQMTKEVRDLFLEQTKNQYYDYVFTHTCPYFARPLEKGLPFIKQEEVDSTMEVFLENVRQQIVFNKWYCGHWHIDETRDDEIGRIHFLFRDMEGVEV